MESNVLGAKSPLYERSNAHLELKPFDYLDSSLFFPKCNNQEKLMAYGILGGIPCYLQTFDCEKTIQRNITHEILREDSFLQDEPVFLLKQELREPAIYNGILEAIASGSSRLNEISTAIHEDITKCSKHLSVLQTIKIISKSVPCTEGSNSKKSIYSLVDNYFVFWFHFLFNNQLYYDLLEHEETVQIIMKPENFNAYFGLIFENICLEYMIRLAKNKSLPFVPSTYGKWWGNNPVRKCQDDIDILMMNISKSKIIICECKYKEDAFSKNNMEIMLQRTAIFPFAEEVCYFAFSKSGFTDYVRENVNANHITLVTADNLFEIK